MTVQALPGPEALARDILHGLAEGRFAPGQRLSEPGLMARYGISRSTVREALGRLAADGVVALVPHRGATIRRLDPAEIDGVLRVAQVLLGLAARQAAEAVAAGADSTALREAAAQYAQAPEAERSQARARYYRALAVLGGNAELMRLMPSIQMPLVRAQLRGQAIPAGPGQAALVAAVVHGNPGAAEAAAHAHLARLRALVAAPVGMMRTDA